MRLDSASRKADRFDLGEVFLEIALVITSITLLSGRRLFWHIGLFWRPSAFSRRIGWVSAS